MTTKSKDQSQEPIQDELYKKREKIYPREVHGIFALLRNLTMVTLLGLYYGLPWINWDNHQSILFDLPERKFYIFGSTFWPQDFFLLTILLIIAAVALFFFTTLAGRLWCGYACPQTVWTEIFLWFERKIEGSRQKQIKLDKAPMSAGKVGIKVFKHFVLITFSLWTGLTFVGYFTPITELSQSVVNMTLGPWETFWIIFYGFATYGNAGWMREQVCIYMCPYARFQSAMFDHDTLIISYDEKRGNPRGARKRGASSVEAGLGDCIDCKLCIQVCPVGIDIREGLQYQCIGCAACIDVCDDVMEKMSYPKGLIKYTTENALFGKTTKILRPRIIFYIALLLALTAGLIYGVASRVPVEVNIIRDRNTLYNETTQGLIENVYTLKLINMSNMDQEFDISVTGIEDMQIIGKYEGINVASGGVKDVPVRIHADPIKLKSRSSKVYFYVEARDDEEIHTTEHGRFLGPLIK
ncbi:cytochrome c oxidase accessory protein CcoG [Solemya elarraichensis gill symbiont]|uniref:Cytochrome c oxidase accessory protein CcoG n=1 Tax=Solemya elarraichensis gill symbiont TaxID=1918949 RepID=A0A1T2L7S8_9GAMM|nr:cytochrome c oxidase accessory protein CcoG [Solemya elarraichensis gill symbiont]OOZ41165.1 cytochrome c oxidase accessory protein CcoG [Solemya elarraichensis gill symbiont]